MTNKFRALMGDKVDGKHQSLLAGVRVTVSFNLTRTSPARRQPNNLYVFFSARSIIVSEQLL